MSHKTKLTLIDQATKVLTDKLQIGTSKHQIKRSSDTSDMIFSWTTFNNYKKHCHYFINWVRTTHNCKTLAQARPFVNEWLIKRQEENLSAHTIKLEAAALAKLYGCSTNDFIKTKPRQRKDITRSRGTKVRDKHFSEKNHQEFVDFCRSTGLRRNEITHVKGTHLLEKYGTYYIYIKGKGGRFREAPIIGNVEAIITRMKAADNSHVWDKIPNGADIHGYRSEYCNTIYLANARVREDIPKQERYCCRKDLKNVWYDKSAMKIASQTLGHNRIDVIAASYLRGIK